MINQEDNIEFIYSILFRETNELIEMKCKHDLHDLRIRLFENTIQEETQNGNFVIAHHYEYIIQNYRIIQDVNHNEYTTKQLYIQQLKDEIEIIKLNHQINEIHIQNNQLIL